MPFLLYKNDFAHTWTSFFGMRSGSMDAAEAVGAGAAAAAMAARSPGGTEAIARRKPNSESTD